MRALTESNGIRLGLMGIVVSLLLVGVGQTFNSVPSLFAQPIYFGQFTDSAGINPGDKVRIAGVNAGLVRSLRIDGDHVAVGFTIGDHTIGTGSRLSIRTDTILGTKILEIEPRGTQQLRPGAELPVGQSTSTYQIYDAFFDVTKAAADWDVDAVKQSLNLLSDTVNQTSPHLAVALDGVARFSATIGKRDEQFKRLLADANKLAKVFGERGADFNRLLTNAAQLLAAINERGQATTLLLARVSALSAQVRGLINDNPNLHAALEQLRTVTDLLTKHKADLAELLSIVRNYAAGLAEALGSGPYFKALLANLLPGQILQPFIDAAFKNRGIDPEQFRRSAGLPAFQWPDPNGTRFSNGAPPPAPTPEEGTPEHPGPAVPPGSPCSYTPPADGLPRPSDPLPCAHLREGPFGDNAYVPNYPAPDVATSARNPNGPGPSPGVPIAGVPGQTPPSVPGSPVPIPPAPPGARTEPPGPVAGPTPPPAYPPQPLPGPPPPPGPGPQVPDYPPPGVPVPTDTGGP
ncbi:MAG: MCE family protein [Mycolicibacterium sp.]|nr:MCE family protein [Mycolicibacterium sp.]